MKLLLIPQTSSAGFMWTIVSESRSDRYQRNIPRIRTWRAGTMAVQLLADSKVIGDHRWIGLTDGAEPSEAHRVRASETSSYGSSEQWDCHLS